MSVDEKALRLVRQDRVTILYQTDDVLAGTVQGDHGLYNVSIDPDGEHCDCPARVRCSHIGALDAAEAINATMTDTPSDARGVRPSHQR